MTGLRTFTEIGIGMIYLIGAVFNSVWTLGHTDEFYGGFADGAWLGPARSLIRDLIIPNARVFTMLLIVFQVVIGVLIITRGDLVSPALIAGGSFAVIAALASNPGGTVGNLILAGIQFTLASAR
jgi:hypothetical protein